MRTKGNQQPSLPNSVKVGRKVQRLMAERANLDNANQRPGALPLRDKVHDIVRAALRNAEIGRNDLSDSFPKRVSNKTVFSEGGALPVADNPQFQDMRIFPTRYGTSFLISGDVFDSVGGDALIDKISDLYLLQTEAAKRTLDFQVAGTKNGAIAVVQSATTGANGTVTCSTTVANGGTFGSFKIKDGARLHFINGSTNIARGSPTTGVVVDPGGNNRSTSVVTFDTVPSGTTTGDYLTYENSALKAPHGLADLVNNDTQSRVRSSVMMMRKPSLIDLETATPTGRKYGFTGLMRSTPGRASFSTNLTLARPSIHRERLTEKASFSQDDVIVCSYGKDNHKRLVEIPNPASKMRVTIQGEIQGQLRSNRPYLKSIVLNATTQRLQVALLVEVHFSLRYRTDNPGNTLILSSPTQKAKHLALLAVMPGCKRGELLENLNPLIRKGHGNQQRSASNGLEVDATVQRLGFAEAKPIQIQERPAAWRICRVDDIVWTIRKRIETNGDDSSTSSGRTGRRSNNSAYMSNGFVTKVRRTVTFGCNRVNSGKTYSETHRHGNPEPSPTNGLKVVGKVQRSDGEESKPINRQQRPALALSGVGRENRNA